MPLPPPSAPSRPADGGAPPSDSSWLSPPGDTGEPPPSSAISYPPSLSDKSPQAMRARGRDAATRRRHRGGLATTRRAECDLLFVRKPPL